MNEGLKVYEVFRSFDGEVNEWGQGAPSVFVRLAGCKCKCVYCDTTHAQSAEGVPETSVKDLFNLIIGTGYRKATITGGEPLLQVGPLSLLVRLLLENGVKVSVETSGTIPCRLEGVGHPDLSGNLCWVVDYKLPSSGVPFVRTNKFATKILPPEQGRTWVKFVIGTWGDYSLAKDLVNLLRTEHRCSSRFAFSPVQGAQGSNGPSAEELAASMLQDDVRGVAFNLQIHKILFPDGENRENLLFSI